MGFFEKLLRGVAGSHGGGHHGRDSSGHHGWGNSYPSNSAPPPIALPVAPHARSAALRPTLGDATAPNAAQPWCPAIVRTAMRTSPRVLSFARIAARRSSPELGVIPHGQAHDPQPPWVPVPHAYSGADSDFSGALRMVLLAGRQAR